jgi:hypothetical protein
MMNKTPLYGGVFISDFPPSSFRIRRKLSFPIALSMLISLVLKVGTLLAYTKVYSLLNVGLVCLENRDV